MDLKTKGDSKNFHQQLSNAEDVNTANTKLINSMIAVSSEQFSRASAYINQYNSANLNLTLVAGRIQASFMGIIDLTPLQSFFTDIQNVLNDNVQQLTVKFSPASVQSYILGFYQSFLTNLLLNNGSLLLALSLFCNQRTFAGTAAEISAMNLVYYGKILSPNATVCINKYNALYEEIYSRAAGNFTQAVETQVSSTVTRLETLKNEIETLVTNLVKSFDQIIEEKSFASIGSFVRRN